MTHPDDFSREEGKSLVESLGNLNIVRFFTQKNLRHTKFGLGSGKVEEINQFLQNTKFDQIIVDEHMTPKQIYNLEKSTGIKVLDRERLILNLFYIRSTTTEAKLQIQLAEIKYELPRIKENARLLIGNERPGKGGSGEYTVDVKFRDLKRRMGFILEKLSESKRKRDLYQNQRIENRIPIVSLVGYTSSGKTTLFNSLTMENSQTSENLFTTLTTTTRSFLVNQQKILLSDTVGFIRWLPTYMIEAFKSTLEESLQADVILLLIDSSDPVDNIKIKYYSCMNVLEELNVNKDKIIIVFSKIDKAKFDDVRVISKDLKIKDPIIVSPMSGYGISKLRKSISQKIVS
ncbi:MAG TPA: GTPase HflX [Nitrososphaeraceae archaeon]|nr:GTPase HflX [Nitrososphaeraceae archaeon]